MDLVVAEPDFVVCQGEGEHMVDERFGFTGFGGDAVDLRSQRRTEIWEGTWISISFISFEEGVSSKAPLNDKIGLDPFRQFPDKFNSSLPVKYSSPQDST